MSTTGYIASESGFSIDEQSGFRENKSNALARTRLRVS